jgi:hypothetical protein
MDSYLLEVGRDAFLPAPPAVIVQSRGVFEPSLESSTRRRKGVVERRPITRRALSRFLENSALPSSFLQQRVQKIDRCLFLARFAYTQGFRCDKTHPKYSFVNLDGVSLSKRGESFLFSLVAIFFVEIVVESVESIHSREVAI